MQAFRDLDYMIQDDVGTISGNIGYYQQTFAAIEQVWVEHNVWEDLLGMRIHIGFNTYNLKDKSCEIAAYFHYGSGEPLRDFNQKYCTVSGEVSTGREFTPMYASTSFRDVTLFLPYDELHMAQGDYSLKFNLIIWIKNKVLAQSDWIYFDYHQH
ncbi:hypothetical protein [Methanosarcina sp. UBA411]|jgi:hypothetical protein|uniref:hypothetical protein n=1 Tax=Methanosarcina sp. UBA411 TaxID=1915589 RepID=UPI0025FA4CF0|nr:hypothetical protein [Methanosarcina sp. UBA411]